MNLEEITEILSDISVKKVHDVYDEIHGDIKIEECSLENTETILLQRRFKVKPLFDNAHHNQVLKCKDIQQENTKLVIKFKASK